MFAKRVQVAALVAVAAAISLIPGQSAHAGTAKSYSYIAWIESQSVIYIANQNYDVEDLRWQWAYEANISAQYAFLEILSCTKNERGCSWLVAREHLDDAANYLAQMADQPLPRNLRDKVNSAQRYTSLARNIVQKHVVNGD